MDPEIERLRKKVESFPSPSAYLRLAEELMRVGEVPEAENTIHRSLRDFPRNAGAYVLLGSIHRARGDHPAAQRFLITALDQDKRNATALRLLAEVYFDAGYRNDAIKKLNELLALRPADEAVKKRINEMATAQLQNRSVKVQLAGVEGDKSTLDTSALNMPAPAPGAMPPRPNFAGGHAPPIAGAIPRVTAPPPSPGQAPTRISGEMQSPMRSSGSMAGPFARSSPPSPSGTPGANPMTFQRSLPPVPGQIRTRSETIDLNHSPMGLTTGGTARVTAQSTMHVPSSAVPPAPAAPAAKPDALRDLCAQSGVRGALIADASGRVVMSRGLAPGSDELFAALAVDITNSASEALTQTGYQDLMSCSMLAENGQVLAFRRKGSLSLFVLAEPDAKIALLELRARQALLDLGNG